MDVNPREFDPHSCQFFSSMPMLLIKLIGFAIVGT